MLTNARLQAAPRDEVNLHPETLTELILERHDALADRPIELDQDVDIAPVTLVPAHPRAEQPKRGDWVTSPQLGQHLPELGLDRLHASPFDHASTPVDRH